MIRLTSDLDASGDFETIPLQVAGHGDITYGATHKTILKKNRGFELRNYCEIYNSQSEIHDLSQWTPNFLGFYCENHFTSPESATRHPSNEEMEFTCEKIPEIRLCLENVIAEFHEPCVVDIKLGRIFFNRHTNPSKTCRSKLKCSLTSSGKLSLRLCGSSYWPNARKASEHCRSIEQFASVLRKSLGIHGDVFSWRMSYLALIEHFLELISAMKSTVNKVTSRFSMISTSILLGYDRSLIRSTPTEVQDKENINVLHGFDMKGVTAKIIDFSNCVSIVPHGFSDSTVGYNEGFLNLIASLEVIQSHLTASSQEASQ